MKLLKKIILFFLLCVSLAISDLSIARSGCCSWHGGVNHCDSSAGRIICNDGTYSPSCLCERDSNNPKFRPNNIDNEDESTSATEP